MSQETATDLSLKYQKLATEYAKLRAQVVVLKKGVLDEQERNNLLTEQVPCLFYVVLIRKHVQFLAVLLTEQVPSPLRVVLIRKLV
jgi:hypothetical protein